LAFNSLSRDHGKSTAVREFAEQEAQAFNSLSRDHPMKAVGVPVSSAGTFNSLSRDHWKKGNSMLCRVRHTLSTPSLGITIFIMLRSVNGICLCFQLPLSGSLAKARR